MPSPPQISSACRRVFLCAEPDSLASSSLCPARGQGRLRAAQLRGEDRGLYRSLQGQWQLGPYQRDLTRRGRLTATAANRPFSTSLLGLNAQWHSQADTPPYTGQPVLSWVLPMVAPPCSPRTAPSVRPSMPQSYLPTASEHLCVGINPSSLPLCPYTGSRCLCGSSCWSWNCQG